MNMDSVKLRDEVLAAQREAGQLNTALAKAHAKIEYLSGRLLSIFRFSTLFLLMSLPNSTDRHRMSQEQLAMQSRELDSLTKRNAHLYDQYTRIDIECNRATEDFMAANSRIEQLRNECANLRAEKKIWEVSEMPLIECC
jgi:nucleoprotein TPR